MMKNLIIFLMLSFSVSARFEAKVDSLVESSMAEMNVPGAIVTVVKDGEIIHNKGYGFEDIEKQIPIDPAASLFRTASITKTFTALAIMDFVEQGKLKLHQDLNEFLDLSEFSFKSKYPITLHHILTHTAGFEYSDFRLTMKAQKDGSLETFAKTSIPNQVYKPGSIFSYSNHAFSLLGYLIESLSGEKYEDYMDRFIVERIAMTKSTFYQHTQDNQLENAVTPYQWEDGKFVPIERQFVRNPAASTLNSTGSDMAAFLIAMLNQGKGIIGEDFYEQMVSDQFETPFPAAAHGYGIGRGSVNGMKSYSHGGGIRGFLSVYEFIPEENLGIFIAQSTRYGAEYFLWKVRGEIYKELIEKQELKEKVVMDADELTKIASNYEGLYQQYSLTQSTFEKAARIFGIDEIRVKDLGNGSLKIGKKEYKPIGNHAFQNAEEGNFRQVGFVVDSKGKAEYLVTHLHSTHRKIPFWRSVLFVQLTLIFSLITLVYLLLYNPLIKKIKGRAMRTDLVSKWTFYTAFLYMCGFIIVLIQNIVNASIYHGPSIGFRVGLCILTLAGISALASPLALFYNRSKLNYWFIGGIVIITVIFWNLNLIGMNYYS